MNEVKSIADNQVKEEMRSKILNLQLTMQAMKDRQIDVPIKHYFAPGIYMREMTMPKDSVVVGKIHKTEHLCVLAKGSVTVANDTGSETFQAPHVVHSMPGTQRALHALEETVWINVHHNPSNETNLDKIDDIFVTDTFEKLAEFQEALKLEGGE